MNNFCTNYSFFFFTTSSIAKNGIFALISETKVAPPFFALHKPFFALDKPFFALVKGVQRMVAASLVSFMRFQ
jgi:hypothetical protein